MGSPRLADSLSRSITQRIDVNGADQQNGYCRGDECRPFVYQAGTLLLDLVDTHTKRLVWRGWAEGSVDGMIDHQEWMEQKVDETVARILAELPRRL